MMYHYPLKVRFKLIALAARISVTDNLGNEVFYIEQKLLAFREAVRIYNNQQAKRQIYGIKTKQIIDIGAQYFFYQETDETMPIGSIKEQGLKTLFKATYTVFDAANQPKYQIKETNAWIKVADFLLGELPIIGLFTGHLFNPTYHAIDQTTNRPVMALKKVPSFWERQFQIDLIDLRIAPNDEIGALLGIIMMTQLQRNRG